MHIATVRAIYQYPVKSMAGRPLPTAQVGWHGLEGDRRLAFRRIGARNGFPWLNAGRLSQLPRYTPSKSDSDEPNSIPTHIITPDGRELELNGDALRLELSEAFGSAVELMQLEQGIFDEAKVSVISASTLAAIEAETGLPMTPERFRPNLLVETVNGKAFEEDDWVGKILRFGDPAKGVALNVYMRDVRCSTINLHPETILADPRVLKAVGRMNEACAGVYTGVANTGFISVGDKLFLQEIS
jgi:uncharacterized protein YcbX